MMNVVMVVTSTMMAICDTDSSLILWGELWFPPLPWYYLVGFSPGATEAEERADAILPSLPFLHHRSALSDVVGAADDAILVTTKAVPVAVAVAVVDGFVVDAAQSSISSLRVL
jgi:hypothetical protein